MLLAARLIESYNSALGEDCRVEATQALVDLETIELDHANWSALKVFYESRNMDTRLELATRRHLRDKGRHSSAVYICLARQLARSSKYGEAQQTMRHCLELARDLKENAWEVANSLFLVRDFAATRKFVRPHLDGGLNPFPFRILECKTLFALGQRRAARNTLLATKSLLEDVPARWLWYGCVALENKIEREAMTAASQICKMVESGSGTLTKGSFQFLVRAGFQSEGSLLLGKCHPESCNDISDVEFLFEEALEAGLYECAERLRRRLIVLLEADPIRSKLMSVRSIPRFLSANVGKEYRKVI